MNDSDIQTRLDFLRGAERLKDTLRSAHTTEGCQETAAAHTWRLTLLVMTFADLLPGVDLLRLLKICVLHDLGEAVSGDIPAPLQNDQAPKKHQERDDFQSLIAPLPDHISAEFLALWDEYEDGTSPEAAIAKAFDKIETLLQHNQGRNPADFDYAFNLSYGKPSTDAVPLAASIREEIDEETAENARKSTRNRKRS